MKRLAPLALIGLGLWLLVGCFHVSEPEQVVNTGHVDFRNLVGEPGSDRKIHVGVSRAQIAAILGNPDGQSAQGREVSYQLSTGRGKWIVPLCFSVYPEDRLYELNLAFDEYDILRAWSTTYRDDGNYIRTKPFGPQEISHSSAPSPRSTNATSRPATLP